MNAPDLDKLNADNIIDFIADIFVRRGGEAYLGEPVAGDDRVFPVSKMTLRRRWEAARAAAGLSDVTVHDIRRTHATQAAVAGVDLRTLAGRIGHSDLSMLEKHYAALVGSAADEAAIKIEEVFSGK